MMSLTTRNDESRIFLTCGAGFVVSHIVQNLLSRGNSQLTLLMLADSQYEADRYRTNLLDLLDTPKNERPRVRALAGDLRRPSFGLKDISVIDSDHWLLGTLPFRLGKRTVASAITAERITSLGIGALRSYSEVESVQHLVQVSSLRVAGRAGRVPLPESLSYEAVPYGNFDHAKAVVESTYRQHLGGKGLPAPITIARIGTLISDDVRRIGGAVLILAKEQLGFGRVGEPLRRLWADLDAALRLLPATTAAAAFSALLSKPPETLRVVNLSDNEHRISARDLARELLELQGLSSTPSAVKAYARPVSFDNGVHSDAQDDWMRQAFGWLLSLECTDADPVVSETEALFGSPWVEQLSSVATPELLAQTLRAAQARRFVGDAIDLGQVPLY